MGVASIKNVGLQARNTQRTPLSGARAIPRKQGGRPAFHLRCSLSIEGIAGPVAIRLPLRCHWCSIHLGRCPCRGGLPGASPRPVRRPARRRVIRGRRLREAEFNAAEARLADAKAALERAKAAEERAAKARAAEVESATVKSSQARESEALLASARCTEDKAFADRRSVEEAAYSRSLAWHGAYHGYPYGAAPKF